MKKILKILSLSILFAVPFTMEAFAYSGENTFTPITVSTVDQVVTFTNTNPGVAGWTAYVGGVYFTSSTNASYRLAVRCTDDMGGIPPGDDQCLYPYSTAQDNITSTNIDFYNVPVFADYFDICSGGESTGSGCTDVIRGVYGDDMVFMGSLTYVAPPDTSLTARIQHSNEVITASLGFNTSDAFDYMKTQFLFVMGGGLGMLQSIIVFIVILFIAIGVIYFVYRLFVAMYDPHRF